jgi:hypothetical protein
MIVSSILHPKWLKLFHPMGGVNARLSQAGAVGEGERVAEGVALGVTVGAGAPWQLLTNPQRMNTIRRAACTPVGIFMPISLGDIVLEPGKVQ